MKLIVCVDENWGIGRDGDLLYRIPSDLKYFKEKTTGHQIIMGKNTFLSLPRQKPLPNRKNLILTTDTSFMVEGAEVFHTMQEVLQRTKQTKTFVIGGESIYQQFLPYCDTAYVTKIFSTKQADKKMVNLDKLSQWSKVSESEVQEYEGIQFVFQIYKKQT